MESPDQELVRRVSGGDVEAYVLLVRRYYPRCLRLALRMLGDRVEAEEAVQDAFVRAYGALERYEERDLFAAWLLRILLNQCRTLGAKRRRREARFVSADALPEAADANPPDIHHRIELQRALLQLTPEHREAILLRYVEDMSYEDAARLTGVGVSALKMRVMRAKEQLRDLLKESRYE
jgi:RNA polymerase sigma-70 factor (ECF subfamily)